MPEPRRIGKFPRDHEKSTMLRDHVLGMVRLERGRQLNKYGTNDDIELGFGGSVSAHPWLKPYSDADATLIQASFRQDYEQYEFGHGDTTWMHLIREEVAELFETHTIEEAIAEAVQVAALCVSLVEHLFQAHEGDYQ